jgi:hypothetical protein
MLFSHELAPNVIFYDIQEKGKILEFLNKKIKPNELEIHTGREHQGRGT